MPFGHVLARDIKYAGGLRCDSLHSRTQVLSRISFDCGPHLGRHYRIAREGGKLPLALAATHPGAPQ